MRLKGAMMASKELGTVRGRSGKTYKVIWGEWDVVYIKEIGAWLSGGTQKVGRASSAQDAMLKAEAFVYNK